MADAQRHRQRLAGILQVRFHDRAPGLQPLDLRLEVADDLLRDQAQFRLAFRPVQAAAILSGVRRLRERQRDLKRNGIPHDLTLTRPAPSGGN